MKKICALLLSLVMLLSLCACGAQTASYRGSQPDYSNSAYSAMDSGVLYDEAAEYATAEYSYKAAGLAASTPAASAARTEEPAEGGEDVPDENPEKIIYSADVTVESVEFETALKKVSELVEQYSGWIESSSVNGANYYDISRGRSNTRSASYTLRIPSDRFDELVSSFSELGNVPYLHLYTDNVTARYYDTQARLTAYQTQEKRLLEMMEIAESVEDVILLEDRLTEIRYQIESLQSSLLNWDRRVSYSTVYLQLNEVREYTPDTPVQLRYGERLARAFREGLSSVGRFFKDFLLWFVEALPTLVILAVLVVVLLPVLRKLGRKSKARREARKAAKAEKKAEKQAKT